MQKVVLTAHEKIIILLKGIVSQDGFFDDMCGYFQAL
jgi:hypothetical protein